MNPKAFEKCKLFKEIAKIESSCCASCHDTCRGDTSMRKVIYNDQEYSVCCHVARAYLGITFQEELRASGQIK